MHANPLEYLARPIKIKFQTGSKFEFPLSFFFFKDENISFTEGKAPLFAGS
jgi:hypothetical protein